MSVQLNKWHHIPSPFGRGNFVLDCEGFHISYNPNPSVLGSDNGSSETAIVFNNRFYILNGDFREDYERLAPQGIQACLDFFKSKPELVSSWSNSRED